MKYVFSAGLVGAILMTVFGLLVVLIGLFPGARIFRLFDVAADPLAVRRKDKDSLESKTSASTVLMVSKRLVGSGLLIVVGGLISFSGIIVGARSPSNVTTHNLQAMLLDFFNDESRREISIIASQEKFLLLEKREEEVIMFAVVESKATEIFSKGLDNQFRYRIHDVRLSPESLPNVIQCSWYRNDDQIPALCASLISDLLDLSEQTELRIGDHNAFQYNLDIARLNSGHREKTGNQ